jgi:hypothetical protein
MDKNLLAGLSPAYALTQGKIPTLATFDMVKNALDRPDKTKDLETENANYKKQLAAMEAAQAGQAAKPMKKGGKVSSASSRGDGCAQRGKTKGTMVMCGGGMTKGKK